MKKSVIYAIALLLVLSSCTPKVVPNDPIIHEEPSFSFPPIEDYDILATIFENWGITIPYEDVTQLETYHLFESVIEYMDKNQVRLLAYPSSAWQHQSVTWFNERFRESKEADAFFQKEDCGYVLISTYLDYLMTKRYLIIDDEFWANKFFCFLSYVLHSEMCMDKLNITEKVQLMALALEKSKHNSYQPRTFMIMISIMLSSNYPPFVEEVKPQLTQAASGVCYCFLSWNNGKTNCPGWGNDTEGVDTESNVFIRGYAMQFINDNKK